MFRCSDSIASTFHSLKYACRIASVFDRPVGAGGRGEGREGVIPQDHRQGTFPRGSNPGISIHRTSTRKIIWAPGYARFHVNTYPWSTPSSRRTAGRARHESDTGPKRGTTVHTRHTYTSSCWPCVKEQRPANKCHTPCKHASPLCTTHLVWEREVNVCALHRKHNATRAAA
jgi:hypothetical protein